MNARFLTQIFNMFWIYLHLGIGYYSRYLQMKFSLFKKKKIESITRIHFNDLSMQRSVERL